MHDNSCSCEAFILSWTQLKAARSRRQVDLGNPSQCRVSIPGQMRHVKLGQAKPEVTEVFNPKCPSHKSIQTFILSLQTDILMGDFNINLLSYEHHTETNDFINSMVSPYKFLHPTKVTDDLLYSHR